LPAARPRGGDRHRRPLVDEQTATDRCVATPLIDERTDDHHRRQDGDRPMLLNHAREIARRPGPLTSLAMDASRTDPTSAEEVSARFAALADRLVDRRAPAGDIETLRETMLAPSGRGGAVTRFGIVRDEELVLDMVVPGEPVRDEATF